MNDRNVIPIRTDERMFYVQAVVMVPHRYTFAVPAGSVEAAVNLANDALKHGNVYGTPDFSDRGKLGIVHVTSAVPGAPDNEDRIEPIPAKYRPCRIAAGVAIEA